MPLVKKGLSWAKQVLWESSVLKRDKLKIKIDENKKSINKSYLYLFIPHLNWLCFADLPASCVLRTLQQISLKISKMLEFRKTLIRSIKPWLKKTPSRLDLFLVKLLNGLFSSCLWKNSDVFFYSHSFFFFFFWYHSKHNRSWQNKIPPSSQPEMISKELESSHLSFLSVNLTDIFKIISKYLCYLETHNNVHDILRLLVSDQVFLSFKFSYAVRYFT